MTKLPEPILALFEQLAVTDHIPQPQPGAPAAAVEAVTPAEWEALASLHGDESLGNVLCTFLNVPERFCSYKELCFRACTFVQC
jgi:hypothetical protein